VIAAPSIVLMSAKAMLAVNAAGFSDACEPLSKILGDRSLPIRPVEREIVGRSFGGE